MDVHPRFFTREEIKSVMAIPKNRRTHSGTIPNIPVVSTRISRHAAPAAAGGAAMTVEKRLVPAAFTGLCALMVGACWWKRGVKEPD